MNVFKKKGKAKDDAYIIPPAMSPEPTLPYKMSRSLKRKQKTVVEQKPMIDLATALPDTNDFRTSLLLPGLSARFSMLREQDDPNTKVGKASDDSVLFPKRASRLNLFAHNPLTDIAETDSIQTSFRAPFADSDRSYSFTEGAGYTSDDPGSVLARSRPTEGNNLFGGRQKTFRVPTSSASASTKDVAEAQSPVASGTLVYSSEAGPSHYRQTPVKGRGAHNSDDLRERADSTDADEHERSSVVNTPSTGFSKSRGTASSTASGPSNRRTSTAATSVVSDSPHARQSNTSAGSNVRMHASGFESEESLVKRNFSPESRKVFPVVEDQGEHPVPTSPRANRKLAQSRSVTSLSEKYGHAASPFSSNTPRAVSPPPLAIQTQALASLDFGLKNPSTYPRMYQTASPTNDYDDGDIYSRSLEPNDRGKATAMGLFNRPRQQFDEQQFQERQLQMHEGRISPPSFDRPEYGGIAERQHGPGRVALPTIPTPPFQQSDSRAHDSNTTSLSTRARPRSNSSSVTTAHVQAQVEALVKRQNEQYSSFQSKTPGLGDPQTRPTNVPKLLVDQPAASRGTFLDTFDGSDEDEADVASPMLARMQSAPHLTPLDVHPALRDGSQIFDFGDNIAPSGRPIRPQSNTSADTSSPSTALDTPSASDSLQRSSDTYSSDSPTLGPTTGLGLSGMIRTHLRHDSDRSSVLPAPSPKHPQARQGVSLPLLREKETPVASTLPANYPGSLRDREPSVASTARTINPPESIHSDPWEFDNPHHPQRSPREPMQNEQIASMSQKAQQILGQAKSHRNHAASKAQQILGDDVPTPSDEHPSNRAWPTDAVSSHHRGESTETQKEFGNQLAERARRIQEGLKGHAEAEKRSRSQDRHNPASHAFQALRHKTSKNNIGSRGTDPQPKAMKMLGLSAGARPLNTTAQADHEFDQGHSDYASRPTPRPRPAEFDPHGGRRNPAFARPGPFPNGTNDDFENARQRSATPTYGRPRRDRADSEAAERSRSRTGRHRDEQPYPPMEYSRPGPSHHPSPREHLRPFGQHDGAHGYPGAHGPRGPVRGPPPVDPRTYERSGSAMSNRRPSGNGARPGPAALFEGRAPTPTMGGGTPQLGSGPMPMTAPRPSPRLPFPHSPISPLAPPSGLSPMLSGPPSAITSALPSPAGPLPAPPSTGRSTPVEGRPTGNRKKSVTKGMISEPTFISSTSSIPLIGLPNSPRPSQIASPPIPMMNPRRRGNTVSEKPEAFPSPRMNQSQTTLADSSDHGGMAADEHQRPYFDHHNPQQQKVPLPRQRNRLRKISSEGGSIAARARNQAMMSEFGLENLRSPAMPVFPNRSATSLSMHQDGGMF